MRVRRSATGGAFLERWRQLRAFRRLPRGTRRIVFYAESGQDWHHWRDVVHHLTAELGETICYVSSDPGDPGLHQDSPAIIPFCIGRGVWRIWFFQWLEADVLVTQLLDLGNLELKRSVKPVHYIYVFHSLISTHMADRADSFDNYDTILCAGPHQMREIRAREVLHRLAPKELVAHGYARLEELMATRREPARPPEAGLHVLVAPSWGPETILPVCGPALIGVLLDAGFRVTLRPHFQTRWTTPEVIDRLATRYREHPRFRLEEEMAERESLFDAHLMVTDWSGAALDFGLGLEKPVLFIDVPPKTRNDTWRELGIEPFESSVRSDLGAVLPPERLAEAPDLARRLVRERDGLQQRARALRAEHVFNLGRSGEVGAGEIARVAGAVAAGEGARASRR